MVQADQRRDVETARHDRGVRGDAAHVGDETGELVALEQNHVGGREIVRHHDQLMLLRQLRLGGRPVADQRLEHALDCLLDVGLALAQVGVLDLLELLDQRLHLLHQRPFGVAQALPDELARRVRQRGVLQDHAVQVDEGAELRGRVVGHLALEQRQLLLGA
jgi:hypothetical protein